MISGKFDLEFDKMPSGTSQQKGINYRTGTVYTKKRVMDTKNLLLDALKAHAPKTPIESPVRLVIYYYYPIKAKKYKYKYKTTRPDVDNVSKLLIDCMTQAGFWKDDAQVCILKQIKLYGDEIAIISIEYSEVFND